MMPCNASLVRRCLHRTRVMIMGWLRGLVRFEVLLLVLAAVVAGYAISFLGASNSRTAGATLLAAVLVALGTFRTVQVSKEAQITERFSKAIEQLASDRPDVCLGGIYALERIARDSARDHSPIMEVLTAHVRARAPWPERETSAPQALAMPKRRGDDGLPVPAADVQAILAVLERRKAWRHEYDLDLSNVDLRGGKFGGANLERAHLQGSSLEGAEMARTKLKGALHNQGCENGTAWPDEINPDEAGCCRVCAK